MELVMMDNDPGGVVYVGKNKLRINLSKGVKHTLRINTKELLNFLKSDRDEWEEEMFLIESTYVDLCDFCCFVIITVKNTRYDDDLVTVFKSDLISALEKVELLI
jgi:hypothetical protein